MTRNNSAGTLRRASCRRAVYGIALAVGLSGTVTTAATAQEVNLLETGSSLLYPLFNLWVPAYTKKNPSVRITRRAPGAEREFPKRSPAWHRSALRMRISAMP